MRRDDIILFMLRLVQAFIVLVAAVGTLSAQQPVCITGLLEPVPLVTICMQGETHSLAGTGVYLKSGAVDLTSFEGRVVTVTGVPIGVTCYVLDVSQVVDPAPVVLSSCGSPTLGCTYRLALRGPGLGFGMLAASLASGLLHFACQGAQGVQGSLLLDPSVELISSGTTPAGVSFTDLSIPNSPQLIGLQVRFQGAHATIGPVGPLVLSNAVQLQVGAVGTCLPVGGC